MGKRTEGNEGNEGGFKLHAPANFKIFRRLLWETMETFGFGMADALLTYMVNKQHLIQAVFDRAHVLFGAAAVIVSPSKWTAGLKNALNNSIPEGYQDETGFHFGAKPTLTENH
jgi:hypothetical protein